MTKHTPAPWKIEKGVIKSESGEYIGNLYAHENAPANAAFIVKACNSHDALVDALKEIAYVLTNVWAIDRDKMKAAIQSAIAKAEGEE